MMVRSDDGELYRKHADDLVSLATTLVGPSAAPDVVAAAVARTLASRQWQDVENRYAYWVRAVVNEARSSHRSTLRRLSREEAVTRQGERFVEDAPRLHPEVLRAVAELSLQQRTVTYLAYWQDLPVSEIADTLAISEGAVRRHLARARSKLRRSLS